MSGICALAAFIRQVKEMVSFRNNNRLRKQHEPFYGKTSPVQEYTCRAKAKDGTTHFFRIITLYVIYRQMRWTVAVDFVLPEDERFAIVQRLLLWAKTLGLRFSVLYLDRGFCSGAVIGDLQKRR